MDLAEYRLLKENRRLAQQTFREVCAACFRPRGACFCRYIRPFRSRPRFVILIHPEELRKRVATGRMAHLCLSNSGFFKGVDFTAHEGVNTLIGDPTKYPMLLFPSEQAVDVSRLNPKERGQLFPADREPVIFILDATWSQARKMRRLSLNLQRLPQILFTPETASRFRVRKQPAANCYSTIESIHQVLELTTPPPGNEHANLLEVFEHMVDFQLEYRRKFGPFRRRAQTETSVLDLATDGL